jgi:hypothetical protein
MTAPSKAEILARPAASPAAAGESCDRPWCWSPTATGNLILQDHAGGLAALIELPLGRRAVEAARGGYDGPWPVRVRHPEPALFPWTLIGTSLDNAYMRVEQALGRPTVRWYPPAGAAA